MGGPHASNSHERSQATNVTIRVVPRESDSRPLRSGDGGFLLPSSNPNQANSAVRRCVQRGPHQDQTTFAAGAPRTGGAARRNSDAGQVGQNRLGYPAAGPAGHGGAELGDYGGARSRRRGRSARREERLWRAGAG